MYFDCSSCFFIFVCRFFVCICCRYSVWMSYFWVGSSWYILVCSSFFYILFCMCTLMLWCFWCVWIVFMMILFLWIFVFVDGRLIFVYCLKLKWKIVRMDRENYIFNNRWFLSSRLFLFVLFIWFFLLLLFV